MARKKPIKKINFADSFAELTKITEEFENEEVDLDEGLKKFERGLELAAELKKKLNEAENKVGVIRDKFLDTK